MPLLGRMDDSRDDAVLFELAQLLNQHLLRDGRDRALELREAELVAAEERAFLWNRQVLLTNARCRRRRANPSTKIARLEIAP
jgi:hypothetical protein